MTNCRIQGKQWVAMSSTVEKFLARKMICELEFVD